MALTADIKPSQQLIEHFEDYADYLESNEQEEARQALTSALAGVLTLAQTRVYRAEVARWINAHFDRRIELDKRAWSVAVSRLERSGVAQFREGGVEPAGGKGDRGATPAPTPSATPPHPRTARQPRHSPPIARPGKSTRGLRAPNDRASSPSPARPARPAAPQPIRTRATPPKAASADTAPTRAPPATQATLFPTSIRGTRTTRAPTLATAAPGHGDRPQAGQQPVRPGKSPAKLAPRAILQGRQRYRLEMAAGEGGMGKVWKATLLDQGQSRPLRAIKTVRQDLRSHQTALQREIALLETLARPDYFPVVHESFLANDQLFMVMDWVEGRTLQSLIHGTVLDIDRSRFLRIVEQIVDRLSYLHNWQPRPIVFRDLKPSNVMLDHDTDHLRLVDFGISHAVFPGRDRVGGYTPGWISPEAANGDVTPATDIYALGRVVLALLFGNVEPNKIRDSSLIPSGESRGLPQTLVRVARRMMAARRADRPPTAVAALLALRGALENKQEASNGTLHRMSRCACGGLVPPRHAFCSRCGNCRARSTPSAQAAPAVPIEALVSPPAGTAIAPPWQQRALLHLLEVRASADLGTLRCIPTIEVQPYGYQRQAATRVLSEMQGRALIADDVGLGKTIEAGLIIKEYLHRQMARRVLIVCPPGLLLSQMQEELRTKFRLQFREFRGSTTESNATLIGPRELGRTDLVIVSLATFRREQNLRRFLAQTWDLLVVDECHHIKNHTSTSHKAVRRLTTRYAVFMSATPFSGKMKELWSIYSALRPGWLGADYRTFRSRFLYGYGNEPTPELRQHIRELTIRRRRKDLLVKFPGRLAKRVEVDLPNRFASLYRQLAALAVDRGRGYLDRTTLMQQICSSYESLKDNVFWKRISGGVPRELRGLTDDDHPKAKWLVHRVVPRVPRHEKVLIFSRFRRSQSAIARLLREAGHNAEALREHDGKRRHRLLHDFLENRDGVRLLVCGEGAGEGLNLQKASLLINYDLPWNPMKVEQRIGRVQRLGQQRVQVTVVNVVMRGTVEEQVLEVMQEKLRVFNNLLGDTEQILGEVFNSDGAADRKSFEHWLASALLSDGRLDPGTLHQIGGAIDNARAAVARGARESAPSLDNVFDGEDEDLHGIPSPTKPPVILADEDLF